MSAIFRVKRKKVDEVSTTALSIGTRTSCDIVLDDPIAAAHHANFRYENGAFFLEAQDTATGTYRNGLPVEGKVALADGDRIIVGVSHVLVGIPADAPATIDLTLNEGSFFYTAKKREVFRSDADEWVRSEVRFGKFVALRRVNAVAGVLVLLLLPLIWFTSAGETLALQPGPLSSKHAALFAGDVPARAGDEWRAHSDRARDESCAVCHTGIGKVGVEGCASCHSEMVADARNKSMHPFSDFATDPGLACTNCHREHLGSEPPENTLRPKFARVTGCSNVDCHPEPGYATEEALKETIKAASPGLALVNLEPQPVRVARTGYEGFSHNAHVRKVQDCSICHVPEPEGRFQTITHRKCLECHGTDGTHELASEVPDSMKVALTWHGTGEGGANCKQCHVAPFESELATVEVLASVPLEHRLRFRSHADLMDADHVDTQDRTCTDCHVKGDNLFAGQEASARFLHGVHLTSVDPATADVAECTGCHTEMQERDGWIAAPERYLGPGAKNCGQCHRDANGDTLLLGTSAPASDGGQTTRRPRFSHAAHAGIEKGCFACHGFDAPDGDVFAAVPVTLPGAADCARCHMNEERTAHERLGGGACNFCHAPQRQESTGDFAMNPVFTVPAAESERGSVRFRHNSLQHRNIALAPEHCVDCHGDVENTTRIADILVPNEASETCRSCHALVRFHWR